ncbi:MAG: PKD domain-containing protein [Candidatus Hydrogenedentes bacterium]|nr:PKD domain-containing protein [Candidatus Hydrogenedentota bacterium]
MIRFLLAVLLSAAVACTAQAQKGKRAAAPGILESNPAPAAETPATEAAPGIVDSVPELEAAPAVPEIAQQADPLGFALANMTLQQKVAQLMVVTMSGSHTPNPPDLAYLKAYTPGAAIIPKVLKPAFAAVYVAKLRGVQQISGVPLWVGTNLYRLTRVERDELSEFIQLPSPLSLAAANDPSTTTALAELMADHLSAMGFNLHLGPSLELAPTLSSAEGTVYSLGSDVEFIGNTYTIFRKVFDEYGIVTVPLGFPGGGTNRQKKSSAVLLTPSTLLKEKDLVPYIRAIEAKAPLIHVGNTLVPTLDPASPPACVSEAVLSGLLRKELGYEGIILAGPMDSQDVAGILDPAEAAIRALKNGADMIYWNGAGNTEMRAVDNIVLAVAEKRLEESRIDEALKRVLEYKFATLLSQVAGSERKSAGLDKQKQLAKRVQAIENQAITVVQNRGGILPLSKNASMPVGVTGTVGVEILTKGLEEHFKPISQQLITTARHIGEIGDFEIERITSHIRGIRTVVCIFTDTDRPEGQVRLVRALQEKGARVVVVLLGYPSNLPHLAEAEAVVLAYCDPAKYEVTISAMGNILAGVAPIGFRDVGRDISVKSGEARTFNVHDLILSPAGRLPVTLSERFPVGASAPYNTQELLKKVQWDFGDGTKSKDARVEHTYTEPGRHAVSLALTTKSGESANYTFHVVVDGVQ